MEKIWPEEKASLPCGSGHDILVCGEMENLIRQGHPKQRYLARGSGKVCEQAKEVFRIQLAAIESTCDIDAAEDVICEEGGIDSFRLPSPTSASGLAPAIGVEEGGMTYLLRILGVDEVV